MTTPEELATRDRALRLLPLRPVLLGLLLAIVSSTVIGIGLGLGSLWVSVKLGSHFMMSFVWEIIASTGGMVYSAVLLLTARHTLAKVGLSPFQMLAVPGGWRWIVVAILLAGGSGGIWIMIDCAVPPLLLWDVRKVTDIPWEIAAVVGSAVRLFIGPIGEEVLFRGVMLPVLEKRKHLWSPALISAVIFTLAHVSYFWVPSHLPAIFGVGIVAAVLYQHYRTVAVPLLYHSIVNLIMLLHSLRWLPLTCLLPDTKG